MLKINDKDGKEMYPSALGKATSASSSSRSSSAGVGRAACGGRLRPWLGLKVLLQQLQAPRYLLLSVYTNDEGVPGMNDKQTNRVSRGWYDSQTIIRKVKRAYGMHIIQHSMHIK